MNFSCRHYPICGGCTLQDLPYKDQLIQKQEKINTIFFSDQDKISPILPSVTCWSYRNKMEYSFSQDKRKQQYLGLIMQGSNGKVFNMEECLISPAWALDIVDKTRQWWKNYPIEAYQFRKGTGTLRTLTIREGLRTQQKLVMLTVSSCSDTFLTKTSLNRWLEALGNPDLSVFLRVQQCLKGKPTQFYEQHLQGPEYIEEHLYIRGKKWMFKISPTSFFQPNTLQSEIIYEKALEMAKITIDDTIYDLYAGTATLGLIFAPFVKKVLSIELNPHACFDAQLNSQLNKISNLEIQCGDVGKILSTQRLPSPDLVIIDPPRTGLDLVALEAVQKLESKKILYISCNPSTQAENISRLRQYQITAIQPIDQFPHTPHIENIILLEKKI